MKQIIIFLHLFLLSTAFGQLHFDRTRVILDQNEGKSQSIVISNKHQKTPFLAQSWISDSAGNKIETPLAALPPLQRVNPGQQKQVKIDLLSDDKLPRDRESLFFLNVLGAPSTNQGDENEITIVLQSTLKLFFRPKGLPQYENNGWLKELNLSKTNQGLTFTNPTAYHMTIYGISGTPKSQTIEKDIVLAPFSTENINIKLTGNEPVIYFVNDYGIAVANYYQCSANTCTLKK